ncbi:MAG: NUDIX domain-containing protein [Thermomicrobiales bacterium]
MSSSNVVSVPDDVHAAVAAWEPQAIADSIDTYVVAAVVRDGESVLIMQRNSDDFLPDMYEIPGGGVDKREALLDTLEREL